MKRTLCSVKRALYSKPYNTHTYTQVCKCSHLRGDNKEPYILSKEPYILSKEAYTLWKDHYTQSLTIHTQTHRYANAAICVAMTKSHIFCQKSPLLFFIYSVYHFSYILSYLLRECILKEHMRRYSERIHFQRNSAPYILSKEPYILPKEPYIRSRTTHTHTHTDMQMQPSARRCQEIPIFCIKSPMSCQKSPIFGQKRPIFCQKSPISCQKSSISCQTSPISCQTSSTFCQKNPVFCRKSPMSCQISPTFEALQYIKSCTQACRCGHPRGKPGR